MPNPNREIKPSRNHPLPRRAPQLILHPLLERSLNEPQHKSKRHAPEPIAIPIRSTQPRIDDARVAGDGCNTGIPARELRREEDVSSFGLPVALESSVLGHTGRERGEDDSLRRCAAVASGTEAHDSDVGAGLFRGLEEEGEETGCEEGVADVVGAELEFVAVGREARWLGHDAGVVDQEVETGGGGEDCGGGCVDGGEVGEIEFEEGDVGGGDEGFDVLDCGLCFGRGACCQVEVGRVVLCQLKDGFLA